MDDAASVDNPHVLSFLEVKQAVERIEGGIIHTPLCEAKLSKNMDYNIYLKCENLQYSGSCMERGVRNMLMAMGEEACLRGPIVPSNGDLALAVAYQGHTMGVPVTVALPGNVPPAFAQRCSELGADVVLCGENLEDAVSYAKKVCSDSKQLYIDADDPLVIAGLGSVGMEIIMQLPEADAVIVPVASGGLLAAVLVACKKLKKDVQGAECAKVPKMMKSLQAGKPVSVPIVPNVAEGLNNRGVVGKNAFATIKEIVDRMLVVDEASISRALIGLLERERLVADGAGVCAVAAVMQGLVPELRGKRTVCIISSGNIDCGRLSRVIQRGLAAKGRLLRCYVPLADHRGGLLEIAKLVADENVVIKSIVTENAWVQSELGTTWANIIFETMNEDQTVSLKDKLRDLYPLARFTTLEADFRTSK